MAGTNPAVAAVFARALTTFSHLKMYPDATNPKHPPNLWLLNLFDYIFRFISEAVSCQYCHPLAYHSTFVRRGRICTRRAHGFPTHEKSTSLSPHRMVPS